MPKCICGCGRETAQTKQTRTGPRFYKYYDKAQCQHIYRKKAVQYGMLPLGELEIRTCFICGEEYLQHNKYPMETCSQFSGKKCFRVIHSRKSKGNKYACKKKVVTENWQGLSDIPRENNLNLLEEVYVY